MCEVIYRAIPGFIILKAEENIVNLAFNDVGHSLVNSYVNSQHSLSVEEH